MNTGPRQIVTDPRIIYDHQFNRWVACIIDYSSQKVILAVSHDASPTNLLGNWTKHLLATANFGDTTDFDTLGSDANGIYVASWRFQNPPNDDPIVNVVVAIKKPEIYFGTNLATVFSIPLPDPEWTVIQTAVNFDDATTNAFAWLVLKGPVESSSPERGGELLYRRLQWIGTNAVMVDADWRAVPDSNPSYRDYFDIDNHPAAAPQGGGSTPINLRLASRLQMAMIRSGFLYTCHQVGLSGTNGPSGGTNLDRSAVQWFKLQVPTNEEPLTVFEHGRIYDAATTNAFWYYFSSMMVNCAGDMAFGFSGSSATNYISAYYAWRPASGSVAATARLFQPGFAYYEPERWGDYSHTSLDPTDSMTFWTVQQFVLQTNNIWGTTIGKIRRAP